MKAILLHHAGGDKYVYRNMQQNLSPEMESIALELPGRGDRFSEIFATTLAAIRGRSINPEFVAVEPCTD